MVDWSPAARGNSANFSWWCATYQLQKHHGRIRCVIVVQQCISTDSWNILHMCQKLPQQDDIVRHGHFGDRFPLGSIPLSQGMVISNWFINAIVATSIKFESAFPAIKYLKNGSWVVWIVWFDITRTPFVFFSALFNYCKGCATPCDCSEGFKCANTSTSKGVKNRQDCDMMFACIVLRKENNDIYVFCRVRNNDPSKMPGTFDVLFFLQTLGIWCDFEILLNNDGWAGCHWDFHQWIQWILSNRTAWKDAPLCCCPSSSDVIFAASPAICNEARFPYALFVLCYENVVSR